MIQGKVARKEGGGGEGEGDRGPEMGRGVTGRGRWGGGQRGGRDRDRKTGRGRISVKGQE